MKPRLRTPSSMFQNPHRTALHLASVLVMSSLPAMAQGPFDWTGGIDGAGTNLFGSGGYTSWNPTLVAADIASGPNNLFTIATRNGGAAELIGNGGFLSMSASPRMGRLSFDNTAGQFPSSLVIAANESTTPVTTTARVFFFEQPDTTVMSLSANVSSVVKIGADRVTRGNLGIRLPASGTSTFHVANAAATLDLSGLFDTATSTVDAVVVGRGAIHAGSFIASETRARIRKTGAGTLDLRTEDTQGNRVLGTTIEGGTVIVGSAIHLGWLPVSPIADHVILNGGTLQFNNAAVSSSIARGFQMGAAIGTIEVVGTSTGILGPISDLPGQAGVLAKKGPLILTLSGDNSYTGGTDIQEGRVAYTTGNSFGTGPIKLGENTGLGSSSSTSTSVSNNIVLNGTVARFGMGTFINSLNGEFDLTGGTRTIRLNNSLIINGAVSNGGLILQSDSNTQRLELNGNNSYEGSTTVNRGRLVVNGEITSNVSITRAVTDPIGIGSLGGEGLIVGSVTVAGELRPGSNLPDSPGTLQIGGPLALSQTSDAIFEIQDVTTFDRVTNLTGISLDGNITLALLGTYAPEIGASFDLFDSASAPVIGPNLQFTLPTLPPGRAWATSAFATTGVISVVVVGASSAYDLWTTSNSLTGLEAARSFDFENDGLTNLQEFLFGGDPKNSTPSILVISKAGATLTLTYLELTSGGTYTITSNASLAGAWLPAAGLTAVNPVDQTGVPAGYVRKQFTVPVATRDFFRVQATEAP